MSNSERNKNTIPKTWAITQLDEITESISKTKPIERPEESFTYLDIASIDNNTQSVTDPKTYLGQDAPSRARQIVKAGDTLFSTVRTYLKNIALVPDWCDGEIASTGFSVIRPITVDKKFIFYFTLTNSFIDPLSAIQRGTSYPAVRDSDVREQLIPIAPLHEQHRIVAKIEEIFTRLDAGVEALKQVQGQLKQYRQAVLKAAMEGRLTAKWREEHKGELEPATELLQRILKERREKWEAEQLAKYEAKGLKPPQNWREKYKEPAQLDTANLPELPEGWIWTSGDQITIRIVDGTHHTPTYVEEGVAFLSVKDVYGDAIHFSQCKYISEEEHERLIQRCYPEQGDIVITKSGTIGRTAIIQTDREFSLFVSVALLKRASNKVRSDFMKIALDGYISSISIQQDVKGGLLKNLHLEDLRVIPLRLPPVDEQRKIVEEYRRLMSIADTVRLMMEIELKRMAAIRQSILKKAFNGKLVPQDPEDEPAEVLLERIKAEKAQREAEDKSKRRRKNSKQVELGV